MQTYVVEVLDEKAVPLLFDLERLAIIKLTVQESKPTGNLSGQFRGTISKEVGPQSYIVSLMRCGTNGREISDRY